MNRFLFAALAIVLLAGCSTDLSRETVDNIASGWRLVYSHDADGNTVNGDKANLIDAVRNGKPVRVFTAGRRVEHAADAHFLTIFEGEVFAQMEPIEAQRPLSDPPRIMFREPGQKWRSIVGTNGTVTALMDGNDPNERTGAARWFVQD